MEKEKWKNRHTQRPNRHEYGIQWFSYEKDMNHGRHYDYNEIKIFDVNAFNVEGWRKFNLSFLADMF